MDNKVNYTLVGIFVVVLGAAFIVMFFWLSGPRHDKVYNTYLTYVHDNVTGLSLESPVRYNGVQVGYVSKIELDPRNPQLVKITLKIEQGTPVTTSTIVTLMPMGITGVVYVSLKAQTPEAPLLGAKKGERYPVIPFQPSFLMQLSTVLPELTDRLKIISDSLSQVFDEKNRKALSDSLENISVITKDLADNSHKLNAISTDLQTTLENTAKASKQFPQITSDLKGTMENIRQTSIEIRGASQSAQSLMNQGRVMIGNMTNQLLPSAQQMFVKLNSLMLNMNTISQEAERNPSLFIRGKQPTIPGPGEK